MTETEPSQVSNEKSQVAEQKETAAIASSTGVVEPDFVASGVLNNIRISPLPPEPSHADPALGEITVIVHEPVTGATRKRFTRANPLVYEAKNLFKEWGWIPARLAEPTLPINLIGMKGTESILVLVLRSRTPVASGAELRNEHPVIVDQVTSFVPLLRYRIMIWVFSPGCGWRYYTASKGGLHYEADFPASMRK